MAEFDCVRDDLALGVSIDKFEAAVGVHGWTNVETILSMKVPRPTGCWLGMDEDPTSHRSKRCLVEIKRPLKELQCADPRVDCGLTKQIEGEFGLWEKEIPKLGEKCSINASLDCQEMVLESVNGTFCLIAAMHVRGSELEGGFPLESDNFRVSHTGFVI
jgi:hypothetical protein